MMTVILVLSAVNVELQGIARRDCVHVLLHHSRKVTVAIYAIILILRIITITTVKSVLVPRSGSSNRIVVRTSIIIGIPRFLLIR